MDSLLHPLVTASVTGGIFVLAAILIRSCVRHVFPKSFLVKLWMLVLLAFVPYLSLPSAASIYNYIHLDARVEGAILIRTDASTVPHASAALGMAAVAPEHPAPARHPVSLYHNLAVGIWAAGVAALLAFFAFRYRQAWRRLSKAAVLTGSVPVERWLRTNKLAPGRVRVSDAVDSPATFGIASCAIVLPDKMEWPDADRLEAVLEHEYAHCRLRHNSLKTLAYLVAAIHWFNPLAWIFCYLLTHDLEMACDESALGRLGVGKRREYANSLLSMASAAPSVAPAVSFIRARNIKERVVEIMSYKKAGAGIKVAEFCLLCAAFALFGTNSVSGGVFEITKGKRFQEAKDAVNSVLPTGLLVDSDFIQTHAGERYAFRTIVGAIEYRFQLDSDSLEIVGYETTAANRYFVDLDTGEFLPVAEAERLAIEAMGGGEICGYGLEYDMLTEKYIHEVEVELDGIEYEIELDAATGAIIKIEIGS